MQNALDQYQDSFQRTLCAALERKIGGTWTFVPDKGYVNDTFTPAERDALHAKLSQLGLGGTLQPLPDGGPMALHFTQEEAIKAAYSTKLQGQSSLLNQLEGWDSTLSWTR